MPLELIVVDQSADGSARATIQAFDPGFLGGVRVAVGDVRLVKGTVRTDVSLGGGYDFAVIVEDASLAR